MARQLGLAAVLEQIWAAEGLPERERRWLCNAAVGRAQCVGSRPAVAASSDACADLESILDGLGRAAALPAKPGLAVAKRLLRGRGAKGEALARRLGRMSKGRNTAAHPDVGLERDIVELFDPAGSGEAGSVVPSTDIGTFDDSADGRGPPAGPQAEAGGQGPQHDKFDERVFS